MLVLLCELGALWLVLMWLEVARVFSRGPAVEACRGHAMLVLPVLLLLNIAVVAVVDAVDAVAADHIFYDAVVSRVAAQNSLQPLPPPPSQRSCH